jgi:hypothetical protein
MNCQRAAAVLRGLEKNEPAFDSAEIEELMGLGLAVEADPDDLALLQWLQPIVREFAGCDVDAPLASQSLSVSLRETEEELKKDWYRMKTSKEVLAQREQSRIDMRRALACLNDKGSSESVRKLMRNARQLAPGVQYVCCQQLGCEFYGLTHKGWRVRRQLKIRLERYGESPLKTFLAAFDKNELKMRAFGSDIGALASNIGYVKKNREQVVIGLAKTGAPPMQALAAYKAGLQAANNAPDVAVTCARNAATFGSAASAAQRLAQAQAALRQAGFPNTPVAMGAAKSLLACQPPESGAPRFTEIYRRLEPVVGRGDATYKHTARLMPASGTPEAVVNRMMQAGALLNQTPSRANPQSRENRAAAVALASMVRDTTQLPALVTRFREIEFELVRAGVSTQATVEGDALECVACAGSPAEVVDTVASLAGQIAHGRRSERGDVAIAVAFAKRFAF